MSTHCQVAEYLQTHLCIQHIATERSIRRFCRQYMCARVPDCELGQAVSQAIDKVFNEWFLKQFFVVRLLCGEWSNGYELVCQQAASISEVTTNEWYLNTFGHVPAFRCV